MRTGSLINLVQGNSRQHTPEVGMGATILMWTDRHAATIIEVSKSGKSIVVQRDNAKRTDNLGMSDAQSYEYTPNPNGTKTTYTLRKNGAWVRKGSGMKNGERLGIGYRNEHYDYSF